MSSSTLPPNPFASRMQDSFGVERTVFTNDAPGRLQRVPSMSRAECHNALELNRMGHIILQSIVRQAITDQLRRIDSLEATR